MGLFHYLLTIKLEGSSEKEEIVKFFSKKEFIIIEKTGDYVSLVHDSAWGKIEILIDKSQEFSIRTNIQNKVEIIDKIFSNLQELSKELGRNIIIYDVQNKVLIDLSDENKLKNLYLKRQDQLKIYF